MKRIISALLILMMLIPPMVFPAHAAAAGQAESVVYMTTDKETVSVGDTVTVTVNYENIPACSSVDFSLVYDTTYFNTPADADITYHISGQKAKNAAGTVDERFSKDLAGKQAIKVVAASEENCLKGTSGSLFSVKFTVKANAPAPGIPLQFVGSFNNLYSEEDMSNTIQVVNTHIPTASPTKTVSSVSLTSAPTKTSYVQGQALNLEGGRIKVTYSDRSTKEVFLSLAEVTQYDPNKTGSQTVKATYAGKEVSFNIETEAAVLSSISVGKTPDTVEYIVNKATALDKTGGVLLLHYNGGVTKTLDMADASVTVSDFYPNLLGAQTIQVQYNGFETSYKVAVVKKALSAIDVVTPMICDTCGQEQDAFALINAAGGDSSSMKFNQRMEYIKNTANNVTCLKGCGGKTFSTKMKMVYYLNQPFDVENAKLRVTYSDTTTEDIDMTLDMVVFNNVVATTQSVEIIYGSQWTLISNIRTQKKKASSISISKTPNVTEYIQGQPFDPTGGKILVNYTDGSQEEISMGATGVTFSYSNINELGYHRVTVSYDGKTASFDIHVGIRAVVSVAVDENAKSTYIEGQELESSTKLQVTYNDGKTEIDYLVNATVSGYDKNQVGAQLVTVTYGGKQTTWVVTVEAKKVTGITVTAPTKTEYIQGQELILTGGSITATYDNGDVEQNIPMTVNRVRGYDSNQTGNQTITVTYEGKTATFTVNVIPKVVTGITVTPPTKVEYIQGQELNLAGATITATYNDDSVVPNIPITADKISGYNANTVGEQTVTVKYEGKTATFTVNVIKKVVTGIAVTAPTKTEYIQGQELDLAGATVTATYNDGDTAPIDISLVEISGYEKNKVATQIVTVTYEGQTANFTVNVIGKVVTAITVTPPTKTEYIEGQELDLAGGSITATYNDGEVDDDIALSEGIISGYNNTQIGNQTVTVKYEGKTATFTVNVIKKVVTGIAVTAPTKTDYIQGQELDLAGATVTATYNDGDTAPIDISLVEISGYNANTVGSQTITVAYEGKTATFTVNVIERVIVKIEMENETAQLFSDESQADLQGTIIVIYNDESREKVSLADAAVDEIDFTNDQPQELTVTYQGKTTILTVTVIMKTVTEIAVTAPTKVEYIEGQELVLVGGSITATYNDDEVEEDIPLSEAVISGYNKNQLGEQTITVKYGGQTDTFTVTVVAKSITGITVTAPTKTEYIEGQELDLTGGKITATYDNGDVVENIPITSFDGYEKTHVGEQIITVTYEGKTATFTVNVIAKVVIGITVTAPTKTEYIQGQDLNLAGATITATYNDGENAPIDISLVEISGYNNTQTGNQTVTVTYEGKTATFTVNVIKKVVTGIAVTAPTKTDYIQGQELDLAGATITATYNDGDTAPIDLSLIEISGYNKNAVGSQTITVVYEGKSDTFEVEVIAKVVIGIAVTPPTKTEYIQDQELILAGGKIIATYNDGEVDDDIALSEGVISGYVKTQVGEQTVTVTYGGQTATFTVYVTEKVVIGVTIHKAPDKLDYYTGQELDLTGGKIKVTYNNGKSEVINMKMDMISGYDKDQAGNQTITVTYGGESDIFTVEVTKKTLTGITVTPPTKVEYIQGQELDLTGGTITATYIDGEVVPNISITTVSGYDKNKVGAQTVTVLYEGKTAYFMVEVIAKVVASITVTAPTNVKYIEGQELVLDGGKITATYNDGDVKENIPITSVSGYDKNKVGTQIVTVTYEGKTASFIVNVRAKKAVEIKVSTKPQTEYLEGKQTALNLVGGKLTVTYDNKTTEIVDLSKAKVSGFDKNRIGTQTISVSYLGLSTEYKINMNQKEIESIAISALPTKMTYRQGVEKFDPTGGKFIVYYNNDTKETLNFSDATIKGFSNLFVETITLTLSYKGFTDKFRVTILAENPFVDVPADVYYTEPVLWAVEKGITNGTSETTFSPDADCTRGQIVTFLWRAAGSPKPESSKNPFKDVKKDAYYYNAVLWAVEKGITTGTSADTFSPDAACTRGQVVTFLWRANGEPKPKSSKNTFKDVKKAEYYYNAVLWAVENGITNGTGENTFSPAATCTRGQIVTFLSRSYK